MADADGADAVAALFTHGVQTTDRLDRHIASRRASASDSELVPTVTVVGHVLSKRFFKLTAAIQILASETDPTYFLTDLANPVLEIVVPVTDSGVSRDQLKWLGRQTKVGDLVVVAGERTGFATRGNKAGFAQDGTRACVRVLDIADLTVRAMKDWAMPRVMHYIKMYATEPMVKVANPAKKRTSVARTGSRKLSRVEQRAAVKHRVNVFREWLCSTFGGGYEAGDAGLNRGCGVLDVAGGSGDLSTALVAHGISSTIIDPRIKEPNLNKKLRDYSLAAGAPIGKWECVHQYFGSAVLESEHALQSDLREVRHSNMNSQMEPISLSRAEHEQMRELVFGCSVLVGMHPDEAVDAIVDVAVALGKPFAVVPCCVFSRQFPDRRTPAGLPVTTNQDLVQYLMAKHPSTMKTALPFDGCNVVVYSLGERHSISPCMLCS